MVVLISSNIFSFFKLKQDVKDISKKLEHVGFLDFYTFLLVFYNGLVDVQLLSRVWLFAAPGTAARQASLSFIISLSLLKLMSIDLVMSSNHLILCHSLFLLYAIFPSIRVFSNELTLHIRQPKNWSFSISLPDEYSGLISFRIDWFDLFTLQRTLKSLHQNHSLKASVVLLTTNLIILSFTTLSLK